MSDIYSSGFNICSDHSGGKNKLKPQKRRNLKLRPFDSYIVIGLKNAIR